MLDILKNSPAWIIVGLVVVSVMTVLMLGIQLDSAVGVLLGLVQALTVMVGSCRCVISTRDIKEWVE